MRVLLNQGFIGVSLLSELSFQVLNHCLFVEFLGGRLSLEKFIQFLLLEAQILAQSCYQLLELAIFSSEFGILVDDFIIIALQPVEAVRSREHSILCLLLLLGQGSPFEQIGSAALRLWRAQIRLQQWMQSC